jgi:hypothetical protein
VIGSPTIDLHGSMVAEARALQVMRRIDSRGGHVISTALTSGSSEVHLTGLVQPSECLTLAVKHSGFYVPAPDIRSERIPRSYNNNHGSSAPASDTFCHGLVS